MTSRRIANLVLTLGLLSFGAASCDIIDPWDPGNGGGNGGGGNGGGCGGGDTIIFDDSSQIVEGTGVIRYITATDGSTFVGIDAADGQKYEPTNLFADGFTDGMRIKFSGRLVQDWGSINNYGRLIELNMIETID
jgi:hypothetical protein